MGFAGEINRVSNRVKITISFQDDTGSSILTALGVYVLVSLHFVILALIEFAFVALLSRRTSPRENTSESRVLEKGTQTIDERSESSSRPS